jgi:hypothetical protein
MEVALVDLGLALLAGGVIGLLWPRLLLRASRRAGARVAAAGLALAAIGLVLPVRPPTLPGPPMAIDDVLPAYQFGEHHEIRIAAPAKRVDAAVRAVTAREIRFFHLLTWLRSPRWPGTGRESILNPRLEDPILDVATRSGFVLLHDEPGREVVVGLIVCCGPQPPVATADDFRARSGSLARAVMNFHTADEGGGVTRLVTETRIHATDARAESRFRIYWRLIYPGSALLRRTWLRAVKARAEAAATR